MSDRDDDRDNNVNNNKCDKILCICKEMTTMPIVN